MVSRECKKCGAIKPLDIKHFQRTYVNRAGGESFSYQCRTCDAAYAVAWKARNPERARAIARRAARKVNEKKRAAVHHPLRLAQLEQSASIPAEIVRPYIELLLRRIPHDVNHPLAHYPGIGRLSAGSGVPARSLRRILNGETRMVDQNTCDKLSLYAGFEFTLQEFIERTREWALLTGSAWPIGYHKRNGYREGAQRAS